MGFLSKLKGGKSKKKQDDVDTQEVSEQVDEPKAKKKGFGGLGGLFGRNKQEKGIIESMALNEAVASMGLSVLSGIVESDQQSAVRELDDGYTVIAITEEMFQEMDVDLKSADFGSFANAISSEHIESFTLENDLNNGVLVLIPDRETLDILDEFSFIQDAVYRWALVPYDIEDDSTVVLLENHATLGDLNVIADQNIALVVRNGVIMTEEQAGSEPVEESTPEAFEDDRSIIGGNDDLYGDDSFLDDDEDVFGDLLEDDVDSSTAAFAGIPDDFDDLDDFGDTADDPFADPFADVDLDDEFDPFADIDEDVSDIVEVDSFDDIDIDGDDGFDDLDDLDLSDEDEIGTLVDDDISELQTLDDGREMIEGVLDREFHNDELGLSIVGDAFNQQFGDVKPITFDTEPMDDGLLSSTIVEMRSDANTRILTLHNKHMQKLRSVYQNGLSDIHDKLVDILDYKDSETAFGQRFDELELQRDDQLDRADQLIAQSRDSLDQVYNAKRDDYGERAKREALAKFDDQNKDLHEEKKRDLGEDVEAGITLEFDSELSKLYGERREVAKRIFDKMTTGLLIELQDQHEAHMALELELYEQFHSKMDNYTRENYTDEVIRAKALATQQRQHHEADDVRDQYEQILKTKQRELEEAEQKAESELRRLENSQSKAIKESVAEYKRQVERRESEITELRRNAQNLQDRLVSIGKEKDHEYTQRLRASEDTIESQRQQLMYEQERADKQGRQSVVLLAGMAIVGIAVGLLLGFVVSSNRIAPAPQQTPANSIMLVDSVATDSIESALNSTFNQMFAYDGTFVK